MCKYLSSFPYHFGRIKPSFTKTIPIRFLQEYVIPGIPQGLKLARRSLFQALQEGDSAFLHKICNKQLSTKFNQGLQHLYRENKKLSLIHPSSQIELHILQIKIIFGDLSFNTLSKSTFEQIIIEIRHDLKSPIFSSLYLDCQFSSKEKLVLNMANDSNTEECHNMLMQYGSQQPINISQILPMMKISKLMKIEPTQFIQNLLKHGEWSIADFDDSLSLQSKIF